MDGGLSYEESLATLRVLQDQRDNAYFVEYVAVLKSAKREEREDRILMIGQKRLYLLKPGGKLLLDMHMLEIGSVESLRTDNVVIAGRANNAAALDIASPHATEIVNFIAQALAITFPALPTESPFRVRYRVEPAARLRAPVVVLGPCANFAFTFETASNFVGVPVREDVVWDVENLLSVNDVHDFNFSEFDDIRDYRPMFLALQFNSWFRSLVVREAVVSRDVFRMICDVVRYNPTIEELVLVAIGKQAEWPLLFTALSSNPTSNVSSLNLSGNVLDGDHAQALTSYIENLPRGLARLILADCGIKKKSMTALCGALKKNAHLLSSLEELDLNQNEIAVASSNLATFLAQPNSLRKLSLANTDLAIEAAASALQRGCTVLRVIDLTGNRIPARDGKALARAVQSSEALHTLNMTDTKISLETVTDIVQAIAQNPTIHNVQLILAANNLGPGLGQALAAVMPASRNIAGLDLSENELGDDGIAALCTALCSNTSLNTLLLDGNFKGKSKEGKRTAALEAITELLESACPLRDLSITGNAKAALRQDALVLLDALGANTALERLNISGHQMGDRGAAALSKALQLNDHLRTLVWDDNATTLGGFVTFKTGLSRNFKLIDMPIPLLDLTLAVKADPRRMQRLIDEIQSYLVRNRDPTRLRTTGQIGSSRAVNMGQQDEYSRSVQRIRATAPQEVLAANSSLIRDAEGAPVALANMRASVDTAAAELDHVLGELLSGVKKQYCAAVAAKVASVQGGLESAFATGFGSIAAAAGSRLHASLENGVDRCDGAVVEPVIRAARSELSKLGEATVQSLYDITAAVVFEKVTERLDAVFSEAHEARMQAAAGPAKAAKSAAPAAAAAVFVAAASSAAGVAPAASTPVPAPAAAAKPGKNPAPAAAAAAPAAVAAPAVSLDAVAVRETQLEHATRERAALSPGALGTTKRRPPTRRPRNQQEAE